MFLFMWFQDKGDPSSSRDESLETASAHAAKVGFVELTVEPFVP